MNDNGSTRTNSSGSSPPQQPPDEPNALQRALGKVGSYVGRAVANNETLRNAALQGTGRGERLIDVKDLYKTLEIDPQKAARANTLAEFMNEMGFLSTMKQIGDVNTAWREVVGFARQAYRNGLLTQDELSRLTDAVGTELAPSALLNAILRDTLRISGGTWKWAADQSVSIIAGMLLSPWSDLLYPVGGEDLRTAGASQPIVSQAPYLPILTVPGHKVNMVEATQSVAGPIKRGGGGGGFGNNCKTVNNKLICSERI